MLLTAALTSLALLAPVSMPGTIEVTRTTTRDGDWVRVEDHVRVDDTTLQKGTTRVNCASDFGSPLCAGFEQLPDVTVRVVRLREDGMLTVRTTTEVGEASAGPFVEINCGGITGGTVCSVHDMIDALDD